MMFVKGLGILFPRSCVVDGGGDPNMTKIMRESDADLRCRERVGAGPSAASPRLLRVSYAAVVVPARRGQGAREEREETSKPHARVVATLVPR